MRNAAFVIGACLMAVPALAGGMAHQENSAPTIFTAVRGEFDYTPTHTRLFTWDIDGWVGGDTQRVWLRSEGNVQNGRVGDADVELYYGWNVDPYWDALIGLRQDLGDHDRTYLAASIVGLSPYFFETEASVFLSDKGNVTARFKQSIDLLLTNYLIAAPHAELNLAAQDVPDLELGAGFTDIQLGLQLRYEVSRRFAPYVDAVWERKLGKTSQLARVAGKDPEEGTIRFGFRVLF